MMGKTLKNSSTIIIFLLFVVLVSNMITLAKFNGIKDLDYEFKNNFKNIKEDVYNLNENLKTSIDSVNKSVDKLKKIFKENESKILQQNLKTEKIGKKLEEINNKLIKIGNMDLISNIDQNKQEISLVKENSLKVIKDIKLVISELEDIKRINSDSNKLEKENIDMITEKISILSNTFNNISVELKKNKEREIRREKKSNEDIELILHGIMNTPKGYVAYVSSKKKPDDIKQISKDYKVNGWTVVSVGKNSINITKDGKVKSITFKKNKF